MISSTLVTTSAGSGGSCADAQSAILGIRNFSDGGVVMAKHLKSNVLPVFFLWLTDTTEEWCDIQEPNLDQPSQNEPCTKKALHRRRDFGFFLCESL